MDLFCFPGYFIISEGVSRRYTFTVHHQKLFVQIDTNIYFSESVLPFLVDFVFESELDIAATDLPRINKQKRHFIRSKWFFSDDVVNNRLRFVINLGGESASKIAYLRRVF